MADKHITTPRFFELSEHECLQFLRERHLGRLAYSLHDRVDIAPLHYVSDDDWIYARTSEGTKLSKLRHHPWCAFEVDEHSGMFDWTSVVVKGQLIVLDDHPSTSRYLEHALRLIRELLPESMTPDDPTPLRNRLVRIHVSEIAGRRATSA
jgi:nitroimidazol reductase NimA-like FMN-containing flavoprotein (pyridoxamine 5'-phosphate oxidase superfamily)